MSNLTKKKDIIELIRWCVLTPEALDQVLYGYVIAALGDRKDNPKLIIDIVKKKVTEDSFIEQFVPAFDAKCTHEEIKYLLDFYKSDVMKKFMAGKNISTPIFEAFNTIIKEVLETSK
ncbi:hypothetical protein LCGC14_2264760 [marine sediment metagenome]|uniref:DUF2059 domain-containing protein n=1 Tax=marine sediment metagenome TaxID=412755 RepID=A0A0F9CYX5_9ZZZZ